VTSTIYFESVVNKWLPLLTFQPSYLVPVMLVRFE